MREVRGNLEEDMSTHYAPEEAPALLAACRENGTESSLCACAPTNGTLPDVAHDPSSTSSLYNNALYMIGEYYARITSTVDALSWAFHVSPVSLMHPALEQNVLILTSRRRT